MNNINYNINKLTPFKFFCLTNFPFIEEDFDALTYYELLCKVVEYLNKVIDTTNAIGTQTEDLTNAFNELKSYVDNYFTNLDVQEEINNKLDQMAESGELAEIIGQYLNTIAVQGYNTLEDLKNSTSIVNGSFAKTCGKDSFNDGLSAFYKIRNITTSDNIDNDNIVKINNSETLIAEKIKTSLDKKYVFVGDSYLQGYTPEGEVENWGKKLANMLGLENNQWKRVAKGGTAMNITNTNNFFNLISTQTSDNDVTDVILCAGYNDHQDIGTQESILAGMQLFKNKVKELYPNADLKIGFIGNTSITQDKFGVSSKCPFYIQSCSKLNINYLNNVEFALHNYNTEFSSDGIHPNDLGQSVIAQAIYQALKTGSAHIYRPKTPVMSAGSSFYFEQENNILKFLLNSYYAGNFDTPKEIIMSGGNSILICEQFNNSLAIGSGSKQTENSITIPVFFVTTDNKTILVNCRAQIDNRFLVLYPFALNDAGSNYLKATIKSFQIRPFCMLMDALYN